MGTVFKSRLIRTIVALGLILSLVPVGGGTVFAQPPSNDDFDNAIVITSLPFEIGQNTSQASTAADDPGHPANCSSPVFNNRNQKSVWFRFTAPSNGDLTLNTQGSQYDTVISVWTGARGTLSFVACNDDIGPGVLLSNLVFSATGGTTYHIEVTQFPDPVFLGGGPLVFRASGEFTGPPVPTATPTPSFTPTGSVVATLTATRTPSPTTGPGTGTAGKNLTIGADNNNVQLSWQAGAATGFLLARLSNGLLTFPYAILPAGTTTYTDVAPPSGLNCYAIFPIGTGTQSDIMCAQVGFGQLNGAPRQFRVALNQTSTATLTWQPPVAGAPTAYLLYSSLSGLSVVPGSQTSATFPTSSVTCFVVGALNNSGLTGYTNLLCGLAGFTNISADVQSSNAVGPTPDRHNSAALTPTADPPNKSAVTPTVALPIKGATTPTVAQPSKGEATPRGRTVSSSN